MFIYRHLDLGCLGQISLHLQPQPLRVPQLQQAGRGGAGARQVARQTRRPLSGGGQQVPQLPPQGGGGGGTSDPTTPSE